MRQLANLEDYLFTEQVSAWLHSLLKRGLETATALRRWPVYPADA
ncbi:hypothetical protein APTSU1_001259500 [Apodemus speciosus]|uniref:Uncharacterized protein n=1 Tax=Apodemus speciosus TaxID=105296 RepID=A0ABQ0FDN6_APOSI